MKHKGVVFFVTAAAVCALMIAGICATLVFAASSSRITTGGSLSFDVPDVPDKTEEELQDVISGSDFNGGRGFVEISDGNIMNSNELISADAGELRDYHASLVDNGLLRYYMYADPDEYSLECESTQDCLFVQFDLTGSGIMGVGETGFAWMSYAFVGNGITSFSVSAAVLDKSDKTVSTRTVDTSDYSGAYVLRIVVPDNEFTITSGGAMQTNPSPVAYEFDISGMSAASLSSLNLSGIYKEHTVTHLHFLTQADGSDKSQLEWAVKKLTERLIAAEGSQGKDLLASIFVRHNGDGAERLFSDRVYSLNREYVSGRYVNSMTVLDRESILGDDYNRDYCRSLVDAVNMYRTNGGNIDNLTVRHYGDGKWGGAAYIPAGEVLNADKFVCEEHKRQ